MKIGIVTLYNAVNYGAYLQAFCLQEFLKKNGKNEIKMVRTSSFLYERWRFQALFSYIPSKIKFKSKLLLNYLRCWKKFTVSKRNEKFDLIIVGSDEIWNLKNITVKVVPEFFGLKVKSLKKITYAVSSNNTTAEDVNNSKLAKEGISNFSSISVRDEATMKAYQSITDLEIRMDLDPTFLINLHNYCKNIGLKNYILVYTYGFEEYMIDKVKKFAKVTGKKIVVVGQNFPWADISVAADPFEFLGYIKNADYVVTDTFHGTILSIHFRKEFVSYANRKPKVFYALKQFDLLHRNATENDELFRIFQDKIDYKPVFDKIISLKEESMKYLNNETN